MKLAKKEDKVSEQFPLRDIKPYVVFSGGITRATCSPDHRYGPWIVVPLVDDGSLVLVNLSVQHRMRRSLSQAIDKNSFWRVSEKDRWVTNLKLHDDAKIVI